MWYVFELHQTWVNYILPITIKYNSTNYDQNYNHLLHNQLQLQLQKYKLQFQLHRE